MSVKLQPKQSLLDYLWVNFGSRGIISSVDDNDPDAIPSYGLVLSLLKDISSNSVGSITLKDGIIIVTSIEGRELNRFNISESIKVEKVTDFGRRLITQEDIDNRSPYKLHQPVYYLKFDTGVEFVSPIDTYKGLETNLIRTDVIDNNILSELKISDKIKGVVFSQEEDGLCGQVLLINSTRGIRFMIVSKSEYAQMIHDMTTLYFIKNEPYMYFGDIKLANNLVEELDDIYNRLNRLEFLITWEDNVI